VFIIYGECNCSTELGDSYFLRDFGGMVGSPNGKRGKRGKPMKVRKPFDYEFWAGFVDIVYRIVISLFVLYCFWLLLLLAI
jgi:hypothetical protein